ncbi:MAG: ATP-binding cassette domain-containing protein [Planctomycetota bacterium]
MRLTSKTLVKASNLSISTPQGRTLFQDLTVEFTHDQVAMIGRNGVGKTTLLNLLAGKTERPEVDLRTVPHFVPQILGSVTETLKLARDLLTHDELAEAGLDADILAQDACSPGEQRRLLLLIARKACPEMLILDEPTSDLDEQGVAWLCSWLSTWSSGLLLVSHNRMLLRHFHHFFIIAESGCHYLKGDLHEVEKNLEIEDSRKQRQYVSNLNALIRKEQKNERVNNRHDRKRNRGRLNELGRCPSKAKLNEKRSYAQVKQGRRKKLWKNQISATREWAKATRRALNVRLDLTLISPQQPTDTPDTIIDANGVTATFGGREVFSPVSIRIDRSDRIAITGRNGVGKTTLMKILSGQRVADRGRIHGDFSRFGLIAQGATNWRSDHGLLATLQSAGDLSLEEAAAILAGHRFPFGLAQRPLKSLSPGERVRAALICLYHRSPVIECLMLDEPTVGLDFVGLSALRDALTSWPGAIVLVSHDRDFLESIAIDHEISLQR